MTGRTNGANMPSLRRRLEDFGWLLVFLGALLGAGGAPAQKLSEDETALRNRAFLLWEQNNYIEALPLLEKLAVAHPTDIVVLERLGGALAGSAREVTDPEARKQVVLRARRILLRAKELGDNSGYLNIMLELVPEDGELPAFSARREVDEAMLEGEAAFGRSDFARAIEAYQRAFQLDPNNYEAALFTGDVYYKMNQLDKAANWFAMAIKIDPDREAAYRYWGDALMKAGKMDGARGKFIDAVVAEPYIKASWLGLKGWADHNKAVISHPKIEPPGSVSVQGDDIKINIDRDALEAKGGGSYWIAYSMTRALWRGERFKKEFPGEKTYRHTLREEFAALGTVASIASASAGGAGSAKSLDPEALTLLNLRDQGLLEAYVLLSCPDEGIVQDYPAYRAAHRDKLVQYVSEWLISTRASKE